MPGYFSDQERGPRPRIEQEIAGAAWLGIAGLVNSLETAGAFGVDFPQECADGGAIVGTSHSLVQALRGDLPELEWSPHKYTDERDVPPTLLVLDLLQFCYEHVAKPIHIDFHTFYQHWHLTFDRDEGRRDFRERVERIFARNGLAYQLTDKGDIVRLGPAVLAEELRRAVFQTGDPELDVMLETARTKFLSPDPNVRRESLEKLWDAWERLKSLEAVDKKVSVEALLVQTAPEPKFREQL